MVLFVKVAVGPGEARFLLLRAPKKDLTISRSFLVMHSATRYGDEPILLDLRCRSAAHLKPKTSVGETMRFMYETPTILGHPAVQT